MNPKPSQNFLRKNNFLIYIFSITLFVKYIILKSQVKALLFIYFKKQTISVLFLEVPAISSSGIGCLLYFVRIKVQ